MSVDILWIGNKIMNLECLVQKEFASLEFPESYIMDLGYFQRAKTDYSRDSHSADFWDRKNQCISKTM